MTPATLYAVFPDRHNPSKSLLVSAAEGQGGSDAIQAAFPDLMFAANGRELMVSIQRFRTAKRLYHWSAMQRRGKQYLFVVIGDGKPVGLINVRAKKISQALSVAAKAYPSAKFQPLGDLATYVEVAARMANVMEGRGAVDKVPFLIDEKQEVVGL